MEAVDVPRALVLGQLALDHESSRSISSYSASCVGAIASDGVRLLQRIS